MMRTRARGTAALKRRRFAVGCNAIKEGIQEIEEFFRDNERDDLLENSGEIASLRHWLGEIKSRRPLSALEKLQRQLDEAVRVEDYEKAAKVRDEMKKLQASE
jgi:protein-arginine kinase activator protein McsA